MWYKLQRPIFTKFDHETKDIFENFHFRGHFPRNLKSKVGQTGTSLRSWDALQRDTVYSTLYIHTYIHTYIKGTYIPQIILRSESLCGPRSFQGLVNFLSHVSILTRDIDIANLSVRLSRLSAVRYVPVSDENGLTYSHSLSP